MSVFNVIQLLGGVGIFLYAIKLVSDSLQLLAGDRLRRLIGMLTRTPMLGVLVGTGVTVLIQSSSATTVMTVSFVDAGLMTLNQAIGVIMGANIGTTVTGQIIAIKVKDYAYLFVIAGVLLSFFSSSSRLKHVGNGMLGFGLLFVGMQTMETAMSFLRDRQDLFLAFSETPFMGLAVGTLLTLLVQSSSATVGLTIALGMQGLLPLEAAIPIILGDNIGTTITAVLASFGTSRAAKQACAAHVLFNVIGVCIFLPLMPFYIGFIQSTASSIGHQIANAHTLFNVGNTLLFLPFVRIFASVIRKIIPDGTASAPRETCYLQPMLIEYSPTVAISAVRNECRHMGEKTLEMLHDVKSVFFERNTAHKGRIATCEDALDSIRKAISAYAEDILRAGVSDGDAVLLRQYVSCSGDLERIGDSSLRLLEYYDFRTAHTKDFSPESLAALQKAFDTALNALNLAVQTLDKADADSAVEASALAGEVRTAEGELRTWHMNRLGQGLCDPDTGMVFIDALGAIEHIAYRAQKIARTASRPVTV